MCNKMLNKKVQLQLKEKRKKTISKLSSHNIYYKLRIVNQINCYKLIVIPALSLMPNSIRQLILEN